MQVPVANDVSKLLDEAGVVAFETLRNEIISCAAATWTEVPGVFVMCSTPPLSSVRFEKSRSAVLVEPQHGFAGGSSTIRFQGPIQRVNKALDHPRFHS